ncbi:MULTISPECIES: hypothetical protein [unclassified Streptomyces]|uniref:hypothetical protein n=1 Tax=unclassified Streptomyces TaxID=2593676 RepID=UPI001F33E18A|nr:MULTISPECIES: hypothetical protein [unclassified Streptomyces]
MLTDHQDWSHGPLDLPTDPAAWYQLAAAGAWQAVVADTCHPLAHDIVAARTKGQRGLTAAWCALPFAVPVLCAPTSGTGVAALQTAVKAMTAEGLPLQRMVVVLTATGEGRTPPVVKAAATMLESQVSAVLQMPFDPHIRVHGLADADRLARQTVATGSALVSSVLASAQRTWGDPLPPAPVPAVLSRTAVDSRSARPAHHEGVLT